MFNRKYKKGMADAAKAYEAFGKKQEEALKHILEEVRQGKRDMQSALKEIDGHIDNIYDYLQSKEKAILYTVYTPFDLKKLGEKERLFLVGALFRLTMDKVPNENQQNYLRAVQKYLEIKEPPFGTDPMAIENIEDLPTQKAILQAVLEFLRLQDGDSYDETELQQEFLDAFSVNNKGRQEIMEHIELLYTATGAKGLAEKYGYVPEEEEPEATSELDDLSSASPVYVDPEFVELQSNYADNAVKNTKPIYSCTETRSYCFLLPDKTCIDKRNGSMLSFNHLPKGGIDEVCKVDCVPDTIVLTGYDSNRESYFVGLFDLADDRYTEIDHSEKSIFLLCAQGRYIVYGSYKMYYDNEIFIYDALNERLFTIPKPTQATPNSGYDMIASISGNYLYLSAQVDKSNSNLYQISLISGDLSAQIVPDFKIPRITPGILKVCGEWLYMIDYSEGGILNKRGSLGSLGRNEHLQIFKGNIKNKTIETLVRIIDDPAAKQCVYPSVNNISDQYITYRIENGKICLLEFETGKIQELVPYSKTFPRRVLPLFGSQDWIIHLNRFPILGKWMYFEKEKDNHIYKIDINYPGQIQILNN